MTESNHGFKICIGDLWLVCLPMMPSACLSAGVFMLLLSIYMSSLYNKNVNLLSGIIFVNPISDLLYGFNAA